MNLKPLFDRVLLQPLKDSEKKNGAIFIPENVQEVPFMAKVIAVGKYLEKDREFTVKVGDEVLFNKYATSEYQLENEVFLLIKETDILAIVNNKKE